MSIFYKLVVIIALISSALMANASTAELILPPGVDPSTVEIEILGHETILHPGTDGTFNVPDQDTLIIVYSDGHNFPTQFFNTGKLDSMTADLVGSVPTMAPGTSRTMNLTGQTIPNAEVYVNGTQAKTIADSTGHFKVYPTVSRETSEILVLVRDEGLSVQTVTVNISSIPLHQSADIGTLELAGKALPVMELSPLSQETVVEKPVVGVPTVATSEPAAVTPVEHWYGPVLWPLGSIIGVIFLVVLFRSQRERIAEILFQLRLRTGSYDKTLSDEYRRREKLLNELKQMHTKLVDQIESAYEVIPRLSDEAPDVDSQRREFYDDVLALEDHRDELKSEIEIAEGAQKRLKVGLRLGRALNTEAFSAAEEIDSQIKEATTSLRRSDERLQQLRRAQQESARLAR